MLTYLQELKGEKELVMWVLIEKEVMVLYIDQVNFWFLVAVVADYFC